ncbi:MAG TPA: hypothetical protein VKM55_01710 [Candidatus Lokiarchaeia archaeon]|nr:hypothetical protein [Candidatus Lokiarchaeia archaeon]
MKMTQISIDRDIVEELVTYKLRRLEEIIRSILERWNVTYTDDFLSKAKQGFYPESENDAIDLKQLLAEEQKLKTLLQEI